MALKSFYIEKFKKIATGVNDCKDLWDEFTKSSDSSDKILSILRQHNYPCPLHTLLNSILTVVQVATTFEGLYEKLFPPSDDRKSRKSMSKPDIVTLDNHRDDLDPSFDKSRQGTEYLIRSLQSFQERLKNLDTSELSKRFLILSVTENETYHRVQKPLRLSTITLQNNRTIDCNAALAEQGASYPSKIGTLVLCRFFL